jgi:hypothetical protein
MASRGKARWYRRRGSGVRLKAAGGHRRALLDKMTGPAGAAVHLVRVGPGFQRGGKADGQER